MGKLSEILLQNNVGIDSAQKLEHYIALLKETNETLNLTRIVQDEDIAYKHILDSVEPLQRGWIKPGVSVLDLGTGGGFPSVPLAAMGEGLQVTAMDSSGKKVEFVKNAANQTGILLDCVCARAEELAGKAAYREVFQVCVSRAVATLPVLLELALPFVAPGGVFIAYKSASAMEEVREAGNAASILGAEQEPDVFSSKYDPTHIFLVYRKQKQTSAKYPRRYSKIKAQPLH